MCHLINLGVQMEPHTEHDAPKGKLAKPQPVSWRRNLAVSQGNPGSERDENQTPFYFLVGNGEGSGRRYSEG